MWASHTRAMSDGIIKLETKKIADGRSGDLLTHRPLS